MNQPPTAKIEVKPSAKEDSAQNLDAVLKKCCLFGYQPTYAEMSLIQDLLLELRKYREGGVTEEILRRQDGYIKVGRGCVIAVDAQREREE